MAGISPPNPPLASSSRPRHHRKRVSFSRLSSDTTSSLPPYRSTLPVIEPFEQPPEYPDSAEEADEESDLQPSQLISPPTSPKPRRKRFSRNESYLRSGSIYANPATQSDIFLDVSILRSYFSYCFCTQCTAENTRTLSGCFGVLKHTPSPDVPFSRLCEVYSHTISREHDFGHPFWSGGTFCVGEIARW